jgi:small nuclear ribonucleoprotein
MKIERPLDMLNQSKGKEVLIKLKDGNQIAGILTAFDIHINIVLENARELEKGEVKRSIGFTFIRGDMIVFISPVS